MEDEELEEEEYKEFLVSWYIHIDARSHKDAAELAWEYVRDPQSTASIFTVQELTGDKITYDVLLEEVIDGACI